MVGIEANMFSDLQNNAIDPNHPSFGHLNHPIAEGGRTWFLTCIGSITAYLSDP